MFISYIQISWLQSISRNKTMPKSATTYFLRRDIVNFIYQNNLLLLVVCDEMVFYKKASILNSFIYTKKKNNKLHIQETINAMVIYTPV